MGLDVLRHDQADPGVLEVGAVVDDLVLVLGVVLTVGNRQPGREHGVELAGGHALPHDAGRHGHQLDVVAEFFLDHFGGHMRGCHAVGPTVDIANAQSGFGVGQGHGGADCKCQRGTRP
ncbi:hypothetical protein D3C76_1535760 [compost metagenome]